MLSRLVSWMLPVVPKGVVQRVAGRYIAGETAADAVGFVSRLHRQRFHSTIDQLGEDVTQVAQARAAADGYLALMDEMVRADAERNVSLKLSQLGLRLDPDVAFAELERILGRAAAHDFFVRIDMEDAAVTDLTLDFHRRARERWPRVGTVLQARLHRTLDDARRLAAEGTSIRLCKGIYLEPREIAYRSDDRIREAYLEAARVLLDGDGPVAFATHDRPLIDALVREIEQRRPDRRGVEFQALLGVPIRSTLEALQAAGYPVRLYVPYGPEWYAYSVRRLRENPKMAGAIARSLFSRDRIDARQPTAHQTM